MRQKSRVFASYNIRLMKSIILFFILTVGAVTSHAQEHNNLSLLQNFMRDVINPRIKESVIIDAYLCQYLHDVPDKLENKNYVFAKGQIMSIREYVEKEHITLDKFHIYKYKDIPTKDQTVSSEEKDEVYACYINNEIFNYFAVVDGKINAFNTMNKAGQRFFIYHCK